MSTFLKKKQVEQSEVSAQKSVVVLTSHQSKKKDIIIDKEKNILFKRSNQL
jgi:hypothetical protein